MYKKQRAIRLEFASNHRYYLSAVLSCRNRAPDLHPKIKGPFSLLKKDPQNIQTVNLVVLVATQLI